MTSVFISVLNMSAIASVVAVAVIIARIPLRKAPKIFSHALWAVVFLRLVCPLNFESPASLMPVIPEIIPQTVMSEIPISGIPAPEISQIDENPAPQVNLEESVNPIWVALYIGTGVWLLGISILLIYAVVGYIRLRHQVYDATVEDGVYRTDKIYTAFVLGFIRPKIYIPLNIKGAQLDHIIKHERVHIKRFDHIFKPTAFIIFTVHWFNPIAWICYYFMSNDMEMSCDEAVLRKSDDDLRQDYSMSLVNLHTCKQALLSPLAFGEGSHKNIKERIKNVLSYKKTPLWAAIICSVMLVIFAVGFTTNPPRLVSVPEAQKTPDATATATTSPAPPSSPKASNAPLIINSAFVDFDDSNDKWPMLASYVTNTSDKNIIAFEQTFAAFDKDGKPLELYWDARGVDQYGGVGNAGPNLVIKGISPQLPKSYIYERKRKVNNNNGNLLQPGETETSEYSNLWDGGWDQPIGTHKAAYIVSVIKSVTFKDGTAWNNPDYAAWVSAYEGKTVDLSKIASYYPAISADTSTSWENGIPTATVDAVVISSFESNRDWNKVVMFLPYMSSDAIKKVINMASTYYNPDYDFSIHFMTDGPDGALLIPTDIDGIVLYLVNLSKNWSYAETWVPYMTEDGVRAAYNTAHRVYNRGYKQFEEVDTQAQSDNFFVKRLGTFTLNSGDIIKSNISWDNGGTVIVLYTDRNYTDDEMLIALKGVPGLPTIDSNEKTGNLPSGVFNFSSSGNSPLTQEQKVALAGDYKFYIIQSGFSEISYLNGSIESVNTNGGTQKIWSSEN